MELMKELNNNFLIGPRNFFNQVIIKILVDVQFLSESFITRSSRIVTRDSVSSPRFMRYHDICIYGENLEILTDSTSYKLVTKIYTRYGRLLIVHTHIYPLFAITRNKKRQGRER